MVTDVRGTLNPYFGKKYVQTWNSFMVRMVYKH
jgi:hypothetical protein